MTTDHEARVERAIKAFNEEGEGNPHATELFADGSDSPDSESDWRQMKAALAAADRENDGSLTIAYMLGHSRGRDASTPDAGQSIDAMLDSVHPEARISHMWVDRGFCEVHIGVPTRRDAGGPHTYITFKATGPTRMEAIRAAVAAANSDRAVGEGVGDE